MAVVIRLIGIVLAIGLADSANPATVAPALFLATGDRARETVLRFTLGVFVVYLSGALIIALGPGQLLLTLVPHPSRVTRYVLELVAGAAVLVGGLVLWRFRAQLAERQLPSFGADSAGEDGTGRQGRGPAILGASITAVELPTAFPLFAVIAAVVGSGDAIWKQVVLLVLYCVCFVAPLVGITALLWRFGAQAEPHLSRFRRWLQAHWPQLLAGLMIAAGAISLTLGATGLAARSHTAFGRLLRKVRG